jgi:nucleotide-binding universal stress UspA family protein
MPALPELDKKADERRKARGFQVAVDGGRVIAGVSGSLRSLGALRAGVEEARLTGAPIMAVLAWEPAGGELAYRRAPCPVLLKLWEHAAVERLTHAFDDAFGGVPHDVTVRMLVVRGKPGPFLVDFADQPDDLLVVGGGGRKWLHMHGSVTRYCIGHAHCPVLTVPPPELITQMRSRPHRWRPEDFAAPLDTRASAAPTAEAPRRASTVTSERPSERSAADLPAYRGAPYYQPGPRSRKERTLRRLRLALILAATMTLVALTGVLLAQSLP